MVKKRRTLNKLGKRPDLGEREKNVMVRTSIHVCHSTDIPCGEITVESTSIIKHCTTAAQVIDTRKNGKKNPEN
jgi:hypothetical protein